MLPPVHVIEPSSVRVCVQPGFASASSTAKPIGGWMTTWSTPRPKLAFGRRSRKRHGCFLACLPGDSLCTVRFEPGAGGDKTCQGFREIFHQDLAHGSRQVLPQEHRLAYCGEMPVALGHAPKR